MVTEPSLDEAQYILPLRWTDDANLAELVAYLGRLCRWLPVIVVDGSAPGLFAHHANTFPAAVHHCAPGHWPGRNGKVAGVMTGVLSAHSEYLILADDDVRYGRDELCRLVAMLASADVVRPQNYFPVLPWHARWDTARSLVNRAFGSDYPGTLGVRRSLLVNAGGYDGKVLFENLELIRTVKANGGRERRADDLFIARIPSSTRHFLGQRIRQAYDDFAQPGRLVIEASLLPLIVWAMRRCVRMLGLLLLCCTVAEIGRRRHDGRSVFPASSALWAPLWLMERALCVWRAVFLRITGGVRYRGARLKTAANSSAKIRQQLPDQQKRFTHEH